MALTKISGSILKDPLNLGEVSIGGTLTYQDVTNVDSVGLITARSGIDCNGDIDVAGISTFGGAANFAAISGTTGTFTDNVDIATSIRHIGDTDTKISFDTNIIHLDTNNSERLRIDSSGTLKLNQADSMIMTNADTSRLRLFGGSSNSVNNGAALTLHGVSHSSGNYADLASGSGGHIQFRTGTNERLRIDSSGNVIVNDTTADGNVHPDTKLHVKGGITFRELTSASEGALPAITQWSSDGVGQDLAIGTRSAGGDVLFFTGNAATDGDWGNSSNEERVRIHSTGYITKPYQVAFFAHCTFGNHDLGGGDKFQFNVLTSSGKAAVDSTHHTFGGTAVFNTSNNTFTAPVAGLYSFTVGAYFRRTNDPMTHLVPRVNNTEVTNGNNNVFFFGSNDITDGSQLCGTVYLQLAANDAVTVHRRGTQTGTTRFYGPHSHFCGHLIG